MLSFAQLPDSEYTMGPEAAQVPNRGVRYTIAQKIQCVTLQCLHWTPAARHKGIGIREKTQANIWKRAQQRGFDPRTSLRVEVEHVVDAPRSGRPKEINEDKAEEVIMTVNRNRAGREKSLDSLAYENGISKSSVHRILKNRQYP